MANTSSVGHIIRFGPFEVDLRSGELRRHGLKTKLQDQPFHILAMLLEHPGEVVTREELRCKLWPADTFVDFDHSVNKSVSKLRAALGDSADVPRFVETLPGHGYRFVSPFERVNEPAGAMRELAPDSPATVLAEHHAVASQAPQGKRFGLTPALTVTLIVVVLLAIIAGGNVGGWRDRLLGRPAPNDIHSLVVLPFDNLSGNPAEEYFADGVTEALITYLAKVRALRVISRTSAMHYKGTRKRLAEIVNELNVDAVVEGAVQRSGDRVRITAQLIQARPDKLLWAESYDRDLRNILSVQSELARSVASEVQIRLTPQEQTRLASVRPVNPDAYEAYLKGRYYLNIGSEEGVEKSIENFDQAYAKDPGYPLAYAGLADSYLALSTYHSPPKDTKPKAKAAAIKALSLDDSLSEAHTALGAVRLTYDWDWSAAERELQRAIELNPSNAVAHHWYAHYLTAMGRHNEAIGEIKRARELDPLSLDINADDVLTLFMARQYDQAIGQGHKAIELGPDFYMSHLFLGMALAQEQRFSEAVAELQTAKALDDSPMISAMLGGVYALSGDEVQAKKSLKQLMDARKQHYACSYEIAIVCLGLGEKKEAGQFLQRAYDERSDCMIWLKSDPRLDALRSDSQFRDLLSRINAQPK